MARFFGNNIVVRLCSINIGAKEKRSNWNAFFVLKFVEHVPTSISLLALIIYLRNNYFHRYNQTFRKAIANSFTFA